MRQLKVCLFLLSTLLMVSQAAGGQDDFRRIISVTGEGKANAPPDMAVIQTGVVTRGATAVEALSANNEAMENILGVLKKYKIASKYVQTSSFNVSSEFKRDEQGRRQPEIVGYRVSNQVRVKVRNLSDLAKVLDALVRAGSNQVSGVSFGIDDPTGVLNQARNSAIADARNRAELYVQAAGVRLGKVLTISEQPIELPQPRHFGPSLAKEAVSSVPVATGEQEFRARIHLVFALEDKE
ncbi:MAG: SIMPL domain-containing protein [Desulfobacteraceae bacterium]|nr:MAG: SIMPL domain-containing protein [Desulfobacteraceae bacterium]